MPARSGRRPSVWHGSQSGGPTCDLAASTRRWAGTNLHCPIGRLDNEAMKSARVGGALAMLVAGCVHGPRKLPARPSASMFPMLVLAAAGTTKSKPAPAAKLTLGEAYQRA